MNLKEEKIASKINSSFLREEQFRADMKYIVSYLLIIKLVKNGRWFI